MSLQHLSILGLILVGHVVAGALFFVLAGLSKILGQALKKRQFYRAYYWAMALDFVALVVYGLEIPYLALAVDVVCLGMAFSVTIYYWGWLPKEIGGT